MGNLTTHCQDHILTENIWFAWSETSYSGDERRCYRCGTNNEQRTNKLSQWKLEAEFRNIFRYWEEASSGRDFVIILTVVVLYQVNLLRPTCNCLSSFKLATIFPHSNLQLFFLIQAFPHHQACMVLSAIFHTFNSHSREASEFCLMLDLGGISCSITASYISGKNITQFFVTCLRLPTIGE